MTASATLGVFVALGAVLTLLLVALRLLKRFSPTLGGARNRLPMEVVQRLPLGPKQSIVVVRVGEKVLTMAVSDGGIRQLVELDGDDRAAVLASSSTPVPFESSRSASSGVVAALTAHPELLGLPGAAWLRTTLARRAAAARSAPDASADGVGEASGAGSATGSAGAADDAAPSWLAAISTPPGGVSRIMLDVSAPAAPARAASPAGADAFRSMLGMALSSATKLALVGAVLGALAWTPSRAAAQARPDSAAPNTPNAPNVTAAPAPAAPASAATALPVLPAATRAALYQNALRQAAPARLGRGRDTQAPAGPGGQRTGPAPMAPGASAPRGAPASADTMIARLAPQLDLRVAGGKGDGLRLSGTVGIVVMMGVLTLLPTLVLMMTGFTRILIVLHFLKQALGTQNAPPNHLVAALALLLTGFVMGPTLSTVNQTALQPWLAGKIEQAEMMQVGVRPFREFMLRQTRERDLQTFVEMSHVEQAPKTVEEVPLVVVMSAFVTSELRTAFQLGFALFLPFIIIDLVVSSVLMSMGMMMLPPAMIALPCKLLLFVLVDGWTLVIQSVVQSFK
ncbi:flagellar biosynthetic protein FliP [Gemmatirosa kalamazoonensis]|uniref:Flagellar biosynthetic protein FliP n=1 Tax=Gemmatirosa kalamazoonensis TaxID=861299 RepID=W0RBP9_9BACT|nr:flagellar type III secretion system pore protein FliP [Gemmatirosa kalamazoonensis]AHG87735.1 flagellar biosynthetic protein FliP [Gemmatirosa kalamazoonensis]